MPINKVFAFGGDQLGILLSCTYAEMARDNLAGVLADEVTDPPQPPPKRPSPSLDNHPRIA